MKGEIVDAQRKAELLKYIAQQEGLSLKQVTISLSRVPLPLLHICFFRFP